ncbi:MAG: DUF6691 family protein [Gemmatimonadota bacterium]|nr:DUF6691 family protein [Gemmatimonadota bacterium]
MSPTAVQHPRRSGESLRSESLAVYFLVGIYLGVIFIKSEVASWFRIQEMFHFDAVHMYGVIGSAVAVGALSVFLMKRFGIRTIRGEPIAFPESDQARPRKNHILGGIAFGLGWGFIGACPGPLFALIGSGIGVLVVGLLAALAGAWTYGLLRPNLPH